MMYRKCKNKKCLKPLPEDYKYKYCEHCRNKHADMAKQIRNVVGGLAITVIAAAVTKGKITSKDEL